jgi:hypothetical protein
MSTGDAAASEAAAVVNDGIAVSKLRHSRCSKANLRHGTKCRFELRADRVNERKNFRNMASGSGGVARRWLDRRCRTRMEGRHHAIDRLTY